MNNPVESAGDRLAARRRFVRNSAICVPVVLTLKSGAASAQAIASQACALRDGAQVEELGDQLPVFSENEMQDSFLRVGVLLRQLVEIGSDDSKIGDPILLYQQDVEPRPDNYWTTDDPQQSFADIGLQDNDKPLVMTASDDNSKRFEVEGETRAYGLVVTDLLGVPQMTDDGQLRVGKFIQGDLTNITVSCMTSISPDLDIQL